MIFLGFFSLFFQSSFAASFTITGVPSGFSDKDLDATTPVVLGSINSVACTSWDAGSDGDPDTGCSAAPLTTSDQLEICFTHDNSTAIKVYATNSTSDTATTLTPVTSLNSVDASTDTCANFYWSSICNLINSDDDTSCSKNFEGSLYLIGETGSNTTYDSGSDFYKQITIKYSNYSSASSAVATTTGTPNCSSSTTDKPCILTYSLVPGDGKAIIYYDGTNDFLSNTAGGWPSISGHLRVKYIRFYYSQTNSSDPDATAAAAVNINGTDNYQDIEIDEDGNFSRNYIGGLENDKEYSFRAAVVDEAGSVGYMLDVASTVANSGSGYAFRVTPSEVFGIFEESRCFIATAAYGTSLSGKLDDLRAFRDKILSKFSWGNRFIRWYYNHSPKYAAELLQYPALQRLVQVMIWPAWAFSSLSLSIGFEWTIFLLSLGLILAVRVIFFWRAKV